VLPSIYGVLPIDGARNPGSRSAVSHHVWFTYRTGGNQWQPKVGICESSAEFAVGLESLLDPQTYNIQFQPCCVNFVDKDDKKKVRYTHDFMITRRDGHCRLIFVRNRSSLSKEEVWRHIDQVVASTGNLKQADDMFVVDADTYTRQRRENLLRMWKVSECADPEADEEVFDAARRCRTLFPSSLWTTIATPFPKQSCWKF
jgi:hypothetical protein